MALYFLFADVMQRNNMWRGLSWPTMDFLCCVTVALISITAVAISLDGASRAAGVLGSFAAILFAVGFYQILSDKAKFLQQGDSAR